VKPEHSTSAVRHHQVESGSFFVVFKKNCPIAREETETTKQRKNEEIIPDEQEDDPRAQRKRRQKKNIEISN
jgi:hypothetical protein